jgi:uncharacterized protein
VSRKSDAIAAMIQGFCGQDLDAHYLGFFEYFNQQLFFEAHEVLEELWLARRTEAKGAFYKALIQLAGAFVHLQKNRLRPAAALFGLAEAHLRACPGICERLDVEYVRALIKEWVQKLEGGDFRVNPYASGPAPQLKLKRED